MTDANATRFPELGLPERLGPPSTMDRAQQEAADALINGPRRGVYGPFRPLLHRPPLLHAVAKVGETLRYEGTLGDALREWGICVVAHELGNVFEWKMHRPLAIAAGVPTQALEALEQGKPIPAETGAELTLASTVALSLIRHHRMDDAIYAAALEQWGKPKLVEVITLVGYFAMVCWIMNVARTPGPERPSS